MFCFAYNYFICKVELRNFARDAFLLCLVVKDTGGWFALGHPIKVLLGKKEKKIVERKHDSLAVFGKGRYFFKLWS
jgi:hypothetical protein